MVKPIRRDLLIHTVEYAEKGGDSMWGSGEHKDPVTVEYVRVEPKSRFVRGSNGESIESDTVLFWD
ncbi:putative minor capsid protein, partial [Atopococcus tabaci]|uniref:putative minor capsid protein n=1 Tax=Atopococcus tabaci TaxID=269774 RepID=UPI00240A000C